MRFALVAIALVMFADSAWSISNYGVSASSGGGSGGTDGITNATQHVFDDDNATGAITDQAGWCVNGGSGSTRDNCFRWDMASGAWLLGNSDAVGIGITNPVYLYGGTQIYGDDPELALFDNQADGDPYVSFVGRCQDATDGSEDCAVQLNAVQAGAQIRVFDYAEGTSAITVGANTVSGFLVNTDGTGNAEVQLPADSIGPGEIDNTTSLATNGNVAGDTVSIGTTGILFEGATGGAGDANEGLLTAADVTADRTWTLPNATGEVSVLGQTISTTEMTATGTPDSTTFLRGDGSWATPVSGSTLTESASAPATPASGFAQPYWDTTNGWLAAVNDAGGVSYYPPMASESVPTTGALLRWNGTALEEGSSANCVDSGGVLTCDDFASRSTTAVAPKFLTWAIGTSLVDTGNPMAFIVNGAGSDASTNWSSAGIDTAMILIDSTRKSRPRTLSFVLRTVGTGGSIDAGDVVELVLSGCSIVDTTPAIADCTELDAFAFELGTATSTVTYGGASANNRNTLPCNNAAGAYCNFTWDIDGLGKLGSNGTVESAAGVYDYYLVWYENDRTPFTADTNGTPSNDIDSIRGAFSFTWDN